MHTDSFISFFQQTIATINDVPMAVHLPVIAILIVGALLCLWGSKLLKPLYVGLLAAAGGVAGSLLLPNFMPDHLAGLPSPIIGLCVGVFGGALMAAMTYRFALGVTAFAAMGFTGFSIALVYLSMTPGSVSYTHLTLPTNREV